jgi:hypothetical protein
MATRREDERSASPKHPVAQLKEPAGQSYYLRPCIAMNAAHVRAEAAITARSGFTLDLADFAISSHPNGTK